MHYVGVWEFYVGVLEFYVGVLELGPLCSNPLVALLRNPSCNVLVVYGNYSMSIMPSGPVSVVSIPVVRHNKKTTEIQKNVCWSCFTSTEATEMSVYNKQI